VLPFASIGEVVGLFVTGEYLSVPASVGFIALWGIAVLNGVVLVSYIRTLRESGVERRRAIIEGAMLRFRPVMMTATVASLGLVPFLFATGPGAEVQRPLAIVVIGGLITSTILTLLVVPALYRIFDDRPDMQSVCNDLNPGAVLASGVLATAPAFAVVKREDADIEEIDADRRRREVHQEQTIRLGHQRLLDDEP
jgi:predicted RND superfamily exporter protein